MTKDSKNFKSLFLNIYAAIFPIIILFFSFLSKNALVKYQQMEGNSYIFVGLGYMLFLIVFVLVLTTFNKDVSFISVIIGILLSVFFATPKFLPVSFINLFYSNIFLVFNNMIVAIGMYIAYFISKKRKSI
ncbi:hypothetical protein [Peptacetobacter hiranonis]|uniref:Uncharacterized protein n=1 Tax=Peptacetobacter hiranonis (strain DSM 13275 / JCM 10541 / KCTC 15199 / TO-931) TaxID=500633 RepID=B6G233_PEPHT|nr:hypothetical protein [Peptacetobacter hiranonis]EEA84177.1 hypothetical protein CLOHIR_02195 [Peptacetobacter hiranonis DSM 13275]QEK19831.1 hypothetical protein KGNDJEFE_00277 [Peptacetobacter hiranonis]